MKATWFVMPWPPSNNANWRMGATRQRVSQRVLDYRVEAEVAIFTQRVKPIDGPVIVTLYLFPPTEGVKDADNFAKVLLDCLVKNNVLATDSRQQIKRLVIDWQGVKRPAGAVVVKIRPIRSQRQMPGLIEWVKELLGMKTLITNKERP